MDGVDGEIIETFVEDNPEDWTGYVDDEEPVRQRVNVVIDDQERGERTTIIFDDADPESVREVAEDVAGPDGAEVRPDEA